MTTAIEAAASASIGEPSARKTGRDPRWPYVPVLASDGQTRQILGLAFKTREEAIQAATDHVEAWRADLLSKLVQARFRALRAQYGVDES